MMSSKSERAAAPLPALDALRSLSANVLSSALASLASNASLAPQVDLVRGHATTIWSSARPWGDMLNAKKFVPATSFVELQERLQANLQYFASNYVLIFCGLSALGVLVHPMSFVCVLIIVALYHVCIMQNAGTFNFGPLALKPQAKKVVFAVATVFLLWLTNAVSILGTWAMFSILLSIVHAGARVSVGEADFESPVPV
jgi:hypothetical protein